MCFCFCFLGGCDIYTDFEGENQCVMFNTLIEFFKSEPVAFDSTLHANADALAKELEDQGVTGIKFITDNRPFNVLSPTASPTKAPKSDSGSTVGGGTNGGSDEDEDADVDEDEDGDENENDNNGGIAAVTGPEVVQRSDRSGVTPVGSIGIAGAGLMLLLLLLLFVRRGRGRDKDEPRHYEVTDEEENSNFVDDHNDFDDSFSDMPTNRLAHVVGEEDSQYTGTSWGNKSRIRIEPVRSVPDETFSEPVEITSDGIPYEDQRLHDIGQTCSSPTCKICESRRQQGANTKFVRNQKYDPNPSQSYDRDYLATDTVDL